MGSDVSGPGADESIVTQQVRERHRGRAGGSPEGPSAMRGQLQKCSIDPLLSTKHFPFTLAAPVHSPTTTRIHILVDDTKE